LAFLEGLRLGSVTPSILSTPFFPTPRAGLFPPSGFPIAHSLFHTRTFCFTHPPLPHSTPPSIHHAPPPPPPRPDPPPHTNRESPPVFWCVPVITFPHFLFLHWRTHLSAGHPRFLFWYHLPRSILARAPRSILFVVRHCHFSPPLSHLSAHYALQRKCVTRVRPSLFRLSGFSLQTFLTPPGGPTSSPKVFFCEVAFFSNLFRILSPFSLLCNHCLVSVESLDFFFATQEPVLFCILQPSLPSAT